MSNRKKLIVFLQNKKCLGKCFVDIWLLLQDLNRFYYYTSHLNFIGKEVYAAFSYNPPELKASPSVIIEQSPCWYRLWTDQQINNNLFKVRFLRKAYDLSDDDTAASYRQSSLPASYESVSGIISDAESALAVQPDLVEAYYNFGSVLDELGRLEEAAKAMQKAGELASELFDEKI